MQFRDFDLGLSKEFKIELTIKVIAVLIALFAIPKFYLDNAESRRIAAANASLTLIDEYGQENLQNARLILVGFWFEHRDVIKATHGTDLSDRTYSLLVRALLSDTDNQHELNRPLFQISSFYSRVYHCRESSVCSRTLLDSYFCEQSKAYSSIYGAFFELTGETAGMVEMGQDLRAYSNEC